MGGFTLSDADVRLLRDMKRRVMGGKSSKRPPALVRAPRMLPGGGGSTAKAYISWGEIIPAAWFDEGRELEPAGQVGYELTEKEGTAGARYEYDTGKPVVFDSFFVGGVSSPAGSDAAYICIVVDGILVNVDCVTTQIVQPA